MKTQLFLNMTLKQFESDFNVIFKPPRPLKSCKMHGSGIKNQKKTLFALGLRKWPQKVAKKSSNWPPKSIQNPPENSWKMDAEVPKTNTCFADIVLEINKDEEFQAPKKAISESIWLRFNKAAKPFKRPGGMRGAIE